MSIHVKEPVMYECFSCGNVWTEDQLHDQGCLSPDRECYCPSCGDDAPICKVGSEEWNYHMSCMSSGLSQAQIAKAYPALFDRQIYEREMAEAGRRA